MTRIKSFGSTRGVGWEAAWARVLAATTGLLDEAHLTAFEPLDRLCNHAAAARHYSG